MESAINGIASAAFDMWGVKGTSLLTTLIMLSMGCQLGARFIPDDSTGHLRTLKTILSVVGLYASNRISSGISVADVTREVAKVQTADGKQEVEQRVDERIEDTVDNVDDVLELNRLAPTPAFPGFMRRQDAEGNFLPLEAEGDER